ncbi:MAG: NAD(+) synthase [Lachnospiraceae bacterium]|nr:NAD(+) synthase [Lachnospiraceae bacterium]
MFDYIRVGAASPRLTVADCVFNSDEIIRVIEESDKKGIDILAFPELSITSYTCGDLFFQSALITSANKSLEKIVEASKGYNMLILVGMPIATDNQCFNCAVLISKGRILGIVPKTLLPNYGEFYEERWFSSSEDLISENITLCSQIVPIGANIVFLAKNVPGMIVGVELCEDLWGPIPPSSFLAVKGASIILNPSASDETVAKYEYRRSLISQQSARCILGYVYAGAGIGESTTDLVFSGHCLIGENGKILNETKRFSKESELVYSDIDLEMLVNERKRFSSFMYHTKHLKKIEAPRIIEFELIRHENENLARYIEKSPFVPNDWAKLSERCKDIFDIQVAGLARRISHSSSKSVVVGISGGLDSTLALLVCAKACDFLGLPRSAVKGITMPGFGTTDRTYNNAVSLIKSLGATFREISIKESSSLHFKDIGHNPNVHNVVYENTQARERTQILMDIANMENGLVVGTGDLSELALGWATYNGDHMSMYGVNTGVPKTLVRVLVKFVAGEDYVSDEVSKILLDVLNTPVSPELLPPDESGKINQKTEELVGPYELHDFFLYYIVRYGFPPQKIYFLAKVAFNGIYDNKTILKWLKTFYKRFFAQQFKRSCLPDGPKVGAICLSPRGDWRMPSDASSRIWLDELEKLE